MSQQRWVDVFNRAGLPAALEPQMSLWLRCQTWLLSRFWPTRRTRSCLPCGAAPVASSSYVPLCVAFESVSVAGERRGGGASWGEALVLARGVQASFALIKLLGYDIYPQAKKRIDRSPIWMVAMMLWFMSRIRSFVSAVVRPRR